ncbi:hypothetical protein CGLO_12134 [Colletotrichum gloeosporioides Cg-14]|uniref:Uncharacterized protein n=1 Tax=Colletotrichum gloeosporioides (strain Cg-14) TaxID=1237896 RepID=T0K9D0_COLGC|nr:hypothetical protein CGLO_12134 [Colletotrichum gloeosporioides Cg-14]
MLRGVYRVIFEG